MSDMRPINLGSGLPETVLPPAPVALSEALSAAGDDRAAVAAVVAAHPRSIDAWARLGALGRDDVERYAAYRVGYHRGLDMLRANGWKGSGYVRSTHPSNVAFLTCLAGLRDMAAAIGELDEVERITTFLLQLDP